MADTAQPVRRPLATPTAAHWSEKAAANGRVGLRLHKFPKRSTYGNELLYRWQQNFNAAERAQATDWIAKGPNDRGRHCRSDNARRAGRIELDTIRESAEAAGVFGMPSFIVEGELFWGREHLADIREKLALLARNNPVHATPSC
jgi:2-hydroxychromene-2-carboxylate isomerase